MTNKTTKILVAFTTIILTAACSFGAIDMDIPRDTTDYSKRDRAYSPVNVLPINGHGVPMAVVSARKYQETLQPYLTWKTKQGYAIKEIYTDEAAFAGLSGENLATAIRAKLKAMKRRPVYVLVVGCASEVPAFFDMGKNDTPHATDFHYGEYTGDCFADAYVGRFSARTTDELQAQIDKTMYMAKLTPENGAWLKNSLVIDNATTADMALISSVKYAQSYPANIEGNMVNTSSAGYNTEINDYINAGCSWVSYFGHGGENSWNSGYFSINAEQLQNANKYPVVASVTCLTGKYDYGNSLAETFVRQKDSGAVAVVACSQLSYVDNRFFCGYTSSDRAPRLGFLRSLYPAVGDDPSQRARTLGQAVHLGTLAMLGGGNLYYVHDFSLFNVFGDPTYQPYITTPKANFIISKATHVAGTELVVETAPDAMVCLSRGRRIVVAGAADTTGRAQLYVPAATPEGDYTLYSSAPSYHDISTKLTIAGTTGIDPELKKMVPGLSSKDVLSRETVGDAVNDSWPGIAQTYHGKVAAYAIFASSEKDENDVTLSSKFADTTKSSTIFLRNRYQYCGIATTTSGGKARLVSVEWAHPTGKTEVLGVYGRNDAYSSPSDAWNGNEGTKLGELSNSGKSELVIDGEYRYLLFRAENFNESSMDQSNVYLKSLSVGWNDGSAPTLVVVESEDEDSEWTSEESEDVDDDVIDVGGEDEGDDTTGDDTPGTDTTLSDYYLPPVAEDEWILTISESSPDEIKWNTAIFTKTEGSNCQGSALSSNAKVRIVVTDPNVPESFWDIKTIVFPIEMTRIGQLSVEMAEGGKAPIQFGLIPQSVQCDRLNIANSVTYHNGVIKAKELWVGYGSTFWTAGGYWDCFNKLEGSGTVFFEQNAPTEGFDVVEHSRFIGYVKGELVLDPIVDPDPENAGSGDGDSPGQVVDSNAEDEVKIDRSHGYDMTEDYWDARKRAIQTGKLLFVLSGSDSCPYCHQAMAYLTQQGTKVDTNYVCYYARRQNGDVPMRGGLPQYGAYDPRTIDAFTGCYDENGKFDPTAAWYSGHDHAFASERGFSVPQINKVLAAADGKSIGKFDHFELDVPSAILGDTPTKLRLYAIFSDGVRMEVDHGIEWLICEGRGSMTDDGVLTASAGQTLKISARNAFYNFKAAENTFELSVKVVSMSDVKELRITSESFNIEDNPDVKLKAEVVLNDDTITAAAPEWTVAIDRYLPLPTEAPLYQRKDGHITLDAKENGRIFYHREVKNHTYDGLDLQDHILKATAVLGDKTITKEIKVYGPTRVWVTEWELVTSDKVAPGSVVRAKVNKMKYTYAGEVYETSDTNFATFTTGYVKDMLSYSIVNSTSVEISPTLDDRYKDGEQIKIRVDARKKGGKYSGTDFDTVHESVSSRIVTLNKSSTTYTSKNGIRVNEAWLKIYYPGRTDFAMLVDKDTDEDGFTTAEEYMLGTDPTKTDDRWAYTPCHFDWPAEIYYRVMFMNHTFAGRLYTIEGSDRLDGNWHKLGNLNMRRDSWMADENIERANACRVFRITVQFAETDDLSSPFTIPGYAVWNDVTLTPKPDERYAAFTVDSNNLTYPLSVAFSTEQNLEKPIFSVPTKQAIEGTLDRFEPTAALKSEGYRFERKENGIWTEFYATKAPEIFEIKPGLGTEVAADFEDAALKLGKIIIVDEKAKAAGQGDVLKLVAKEIVAGKWILSVEIAPELMANGRKIDDTVAALGKALSTLLLQAQSRAETTTIELPAESVTPGLYYSVCYSSLPDFNSYSESTRVLAKPSESLVLEIPSDAAPARFFKVKASMTARP